MEKLSIKTREGWKEAQFIGVFQRSTIVEPSVRVGGHSGGVVAFPVAVVKVEGGLQELSLSDVKFES
jgi:hypothetical protein